MNEKFQVRVTFNTYKHHFKFLLNQIQIWQNQEWKQVDTKLIGIGENLLDFYIGELTVENICDECIHFFKSLNVTDKVAFTKWLYPLEYRKIALSDTSEWIIKEGNNPNLFVHIHPAKHSPQTVRVRASTLKTVLAVMIKSGSISEQMSENLQTVNKIRTEYLRLSPVKSLQRGKGIFQLWLLFAKNYQQHCH